MLPISIIMPCYNSERYIEDSISSMLLQSFADFEMIIVNDGSIDNTTRIVENFKDSRIISIQNTTNSGNYFARNLGMCRARGKYICIMDSDDISLESRLEVQYNYLEDHPKVGLIGCNADIIDEDGFTIGSMKNPENGKELEIGLLANNRLIHPTLFFRRSLIQKYDLFYDTRYNFASDYDFTIRCSRLLRIGNLPNSLIKYRRHSAQISTARKSEQSKYADLIRIGQLERFGIEYSESEKNIHLRLMRLERIETSEKPNAERWLNKLLVANYKNKCYHRSLLFEFFNRIFIVTCL